MTRINQSDTISDLHYALTELQCNKCGSPLKWKTNFSDVNQPKYFSSHCNQDFVISIASVRIEAQKLEKNENNPKILKKSKNIKYVEKNEKATGRIRKVSVMLRKKEIEPRATALRKEHRQGKERQKTHRPGNSLCFQARETETSSSSLVPQGHKCNANDPDDKDKEETKHQTRELILPSDSNVVKGNV
jgi:hypothetical protein